MTAAIVTAIRTMTGDEWFIAAMIGTLVFIYCGLMLTPHYGSEGG